MIRRSYLIFLLSFFSSSMMLAQEWLQKMNSPSANYFDVQQAYQQWHDSIDATPRRTMQGALSIYPDSIKVLLKQYKHWAREFEMNMDADGNRMSVDAQLQHRAETMRLNGPPDMLQQSGNWQPIGPVYTFPTTDNYGSGLVGDVDVHPLDTSIIFAAVGGGGLWRTLDGGNFWEPLTDTLAALTTRCLAVDPLNGSFVFVAIGSTLYMSVDTGDSWMPTPTPAAFVAGANWLTIDPVNTQNMYLAGNDGLARTTDGGLTWNWIHNSWLRDIELNAVDPETIYFMSNGWFYRSYDKGTTIDSALMNTPWMAFDIAVTPADTNYVYVYAGEGSGGNGMVALSTDGGTTFINQPNATILWTFNSLKRIFVSPTNPNEIYFYGIILEKSTDAGVTWNHLIYQPGLPYMHVDERGIEMLGNSVWFGNDGGVYKTDDWGISFRDITGNMQIGQLLSIDCSPTDSTVMLTGVTHMGVQVNTDSGWATVGAGDGVNVAINPVNPLDIFYKTQYGYNHSLDGGLSTVAINGLTESQYSFTTQHPLIFHSQYPNQVYTVSKNVFKSMDGGLNFTPISNLPLTFPQQGVLHVSPHDTNFIYAAQYKSTDGGVSWVPWNKTFIKIAVDPDEPWRIWCATREHNVTAVYYSPDTGNTWLSIPSFDLPNDWVSDFEYVDNGFDGLMLITRYGVYYLDSRLSNWQPFNEGLPYAFTMDLIVLDSLSKVRIATNGRGLWESSMYDATQPLAVDFISDKDTICPGGTIQFYDNSLNNGPGFNPVYSWSFPGGAPGTSSSPQPAVTYPSSGIYAVSLTITNTNGTDSITKSGYIIVEPPLISTAPFAEDFEGTFPPQGWYLNYPPSYTEWHKDNHGGYGLSAFSALHFNNIGPMAPLSYTMITNEIDLTGLQYPILYFDRAYAMDTLNNADTLKIFYTTDCGLTKTYIYEKGGNDLSTAPPTYFAFIPDSFQWATDTVVLHNAPAMVQIGFEDVCHNGNYLYLDNINIANGTATTSLEEKFIPGNSLSIYPVPASGYVNIQWDSGNNSPASASVFDCLGQQVMHSIELKKGKNRFDVSLLSPGIYSLQVIAEEEVLVKTIVVF